jgi:hypothetical protein
LLELTGSSKLNLKQKKNQIFFVAKWLLWVIKSFNLKYRNGWKKMFLVLYLQVFSIFVGERSLMEEH